MICFATSICMYHNLLAATGVYSITLVVAYLLLGAD
jgi:hypothetical protein